MIKRMMQKGIMPLMVVVAVVFGCNAETAAKTDTRGQGVSSGIEDQQEVSVTIYNVDLGLVKDIRDINIQKGVSELRFMDVASQIIPESVYIRSMKDSESLGVLEQNYEYDLLNPQKLLDKYVGRQVKLYTKNYYTEREELVEATVLSNNGSPIFRIGDEITYGHPGRIIFPGVPDDLIAQPTLVWLLDNALGSGQTLEASYLTNGINWKADYVVTLNDSDDRAGLSGWVTIDNRSGATYKNANLKLVAGDVNRVRDEFAFRGRMLEAAKAAAPEEQFREDAFFEYHIYTLQRRATVKNNQKKQIQLVDAGDIPVRKELTYYGSQYYYRNRHGNTISNEKVGVFIEISNKKENNLGMPLPKGTVRVYKHDSEGSLQFVGEDRIDHTPKNEKVRIRLGDAFDVVGSRKQMSWEKIAWDTYEASYEISLRNHKKEDVVVKVIEPIPGDWKILTTSHDYRKTDSSTAEFMVSVPQDTEINIRYKLRMRF